MPADYRILLRLLVLAILLVPATAAAQTARISVDLALTSGTPIAGTNLTFSITANNEGPDDAANASLTFAVPTNSTFVSLVIPAGWSCAPSLPVGGTGSATCTEATFAPGSEVFTLTVKTLPSAPQGTSVKLNASITSTTSDPNQNDNSNELEVLLVRQSTLAVTKTGPAGAFAGAAITYTIAINNSGPSFGSDLTVTDTFAAPLRFVSVTAAGWTCGTTPAVGSPGTVICTIAEIPLGVTNLTLKLDTAPSTAPTNVTNDVSVSASTDPFGPRLSSATTQITTSADLTITKVLTPTPPVAGQPVTYTITVSQNGPSDAANVAVNDPLPSAVLFQSINAPGWTCSTPAVGSSGTVSCTRTPLAPGVYPFVIQAILSASTPSGTVISNTATATSTTPDPTVPNTVTLSATATTQADLSITKAAAPPSPIAGQALTYTITVTQNGPSDAANVAVNDPLPSTVLFQSINPPGWTCSTPAVGASGTVSCTRTPLAPGVYTITIQAIVSASTPTGTVISNTATATSTTPDPTVPNTSTASVTATTQADLTISKSSTPPAPIAGQALTYTITITQSGPSDAANVVVSDPLPSLVLFQSITAPGWTCTTPAVGSHGTVSCTRTSLAPGVSTIAIQALVPASTPSGTAVNNTASVTSTTTDPTQPNTASVSAAVATQADLSVTIADSPDPATILGTLTYQVVVSNGGPSDAIGLTLSVSLASALRFVSLTSPGGWTCTAPAVGTAGTVFCQAASLANGASAAFTIVTTVNVATNVSQSISTSATVASSVTDPNPANNSVTATTAVSASAIPTLSDVTFLALAGLLVLVAVLRLGARRSRRT